MDKKAYLKNSLKETNERITTLIYLKDKYKEDIIPFANLILKYKENKELGRIVQKELNICFFQKNKLNSKIQKLEG